MEIAHRKREHTQGPLQRGIESPLEAQRLNASGGWTSHQVLRALTLDQASMSPQRLSPRSNTFNYFEDTLEIARLHIATAHCSCRKRPSRAGTVAISGSRPTGLPSSPGLIASPLHRFVRPSSLFAALNTRHGQRNGRIAIRHPGWFLQV